MLGRDLVMVPKLIHPLPPAAPGTPRSRDDDDDDIEQEPPTPHPLSDTWMQARRRTCLLVRFSRCFVVLRLQSTLRLCLFEILRLQFDWLVHVTSTQPASYLML